MTIQFTSPVGRLVQGDAFVPQTTDAQGAPRVIKTGANAGQPSPQYFLGVAFAKHNPEWPAFRALIDGEARAGFPHLFTGPDGACTHPAFSYKVIDGDGLDTGGRAWSTREGFAGHWVVRFTSGFAPQVGTQTTPGQYRMIDAGELKCGDFIRVAGSIRGNDNAQRPGVYVGASLVERVAFGAPIVSGPSMADAFGATPVGALPAGASLTPVAAPGPIPAPPAPPAPPVAPAPPAPPAPPVARAMLPAAGATTYEGYLAAGWTDAQMVAAGYLAD